MKWNICLKTQIQGKIVAIFGKVIFVHGSNYILFFIG